jgi:hypothetical protein
MDPVGTVLVLFVLWLIANDPDVIQFKPSEEAMPVKKCCGTCAHARPLPLQEPLECHGAPPTGLPVQGGVMSVWPPVSPDWWCASYQEKTEENTIPMPTQKRIIAGGGLNG